MPTQLQLHVDQLLSNVSTKYRNSNYIAMDLFPEVPVVKSSDLYRIYERNFRVPDSQRSTKAEAREWQFYVSTASYLLVRHSLKELVSDRDAENYDINDLRADTTEELTDALLRKMEKDAASLITTTSWSLNLTLAAAAAWNATTTVDPVSHFDTGTTTLVNNSGQSPNIAAMGLSAWFAFKNNAQILDRIKYTSQEVGENIAAKLIGVDRILLAKMSEDTANEGASGGAVISAMWTDRVFLGYRPTAAGPMKPSAGYTFRASVPMTKRYRDEAREGDWIEANMEYQIKVVSSLSGFIIADVT